MEIKGIFFDVDGTLISHKHGKISKTTLETLYALKEKGICLFLATGRHLCELIELQIDFPFDGYVMLNGQLCLDSRQNVILANPIEGKDQEILVNIFKTCQFPLVLVEKDRLYINQETPQVKEAQKSISSKVPELDTYNGKPFYQGTAFIDEQTTKRLQDQLENCTITRWNPYGVDIISKKGGKDKGIQAMLTHYHIDVKETMSFGDGENDLEMLKFAGLSYAMANGQDIVKKTAKFIAPTNNDNGVFKVLNKYLDEAE